MNATITAWRKYARYGPIQARKAKVEDHEGAGLSDKSFPHSHSVGTHDRCGTT